MFRLASFSHNYFCFSRPIVTLCLLAPPNMWCANARFAVLVNSRYGTWYSERAIQQCALALGLAVHIFATQCWWVPIKTKQLLTVAILLYRFLSCWCLETSFTQYQPCSLLLVLFAALRLFLVACLQVIDSEGDQRFNFPSKRAMFFWAASFALSNI